MQVLNKERVRRLEKLGFMRDEGRMVLPDMSDDSFRIDEVIEHKNQPELFKSRLDKFITNTRENKMYGQWSDNNGKYG